MQADTKYIDLEKKLIAAQKLSLLPAIELFADMPHWRAIQQIELQRQEVIEMYLNGSLTDENRKYMLELFEHCNDQIKLALGL